MKFIVKLLLILCLFSWSGSASAGVLAEYMEAKKIYMAAGACMAAYSSRPGSLAVAAFEQEGWRVEPFKMKGDKADVKYLLAWNSNSQADRDVYLLAVAGTESVRDAKLDLRTKKVYFAGSTLAEFTANAARNDLPPDVPRVHEGFNQAAQLLLFAESAQANDSQSGKLRILSNILKEDRDDKVYLVGHSLGGAVVTLTAARLLDMGVQPKQIEVITFGAPAVGNDAFVQKYDGKVAVTRVVLEGDPVPNALRKVFGGYRHVGGEITWRMPDTLREYFSHEVPVYVDMALKSYYPRRRAAMTEGLLALPEPVAGKNRLYIAPIKNSLPPALKYEFPFMQEALWEEYGRMLPGYVADSGGDSPLSDLEKAAAAGCTLLVVPEIQAVRNRDENTYYVSLNQTVFRVRDGAALSVGMYGSHTKELTPMDALIHGARSMRTESASWVESD